MKETILVIDDQANILTLLQDFLTHQGFHVVTATNGRNALETSWIENPDLILLDIMMPEMDGFQFLTIFRQAHQTPVIIMTAREDEKDIMQVFELGANDWVYKPFQMRDLLARIRASLCLSSQTAKQSDLMVEYLQ